MHPANLSTDDIRLFQNIEGICFREKGTVALRGMVVEI